MAHRFTTSGHATRAVKRALRDAGLEARVHTTIQSTNDRTGYVYSTNVWPLGVADNKAHTAALEAAGWAVEDWDFFLGISTPITQD